MARSRRRHERRLRPSPQCAGTEGMISVRKCCAGRTHHPCPLALDRHDALARASPGAVWSGPGGSRARGAALRAPARPARGLLGVEPGCLVGLDGQHLAAAPIGAIRLGIVPVRVASAIRPGPYDQRMVPAGSLGSSTGVASDLDAPERPRRLSGWATATFVVTALATALLTLAVVLWWPISMAAIERADDAGWDESLLLPNQFLLDLAIMGSWAGGVAATAMTFIVMRRSGPTSAHRH